MAGTTVDTWILKGKCHEIFDSYFLALNMLYLDPFMGKYKRGRKFRDTVSLISDTQLGM